MGHSLSTLFHTDDSYASKRTAIETLTRHTDTPYKVGASELDRASDGAAQLDIAKLSVKPTNEPKPLPDLKALTFGTVFSDHMAITSFHPVSGWSAPEIKPYGPIALDPSSSCFQYGGNIFEGMKAYLGHDGKVRLFRPHLNMRRMERSMGRLALPPVDGDVVLEIIKRLVQTEKRWIPTQPGYSLYLRPTVIGTRPALGVAASDHAILYIIASPSGPYFARPISLLAVKHAVRAWPGGTGGDKFAGNYSPTFLPQREATAQGYDQILWLFGEDGRVTEGGAMNVFVVVKREDGDGWDVVTAPLDGTILPGVTRASCLELAADPDFQKTVSSSGATLHTAERTFTIHDLARWSADGTLLEVLCVGTAAIVAAVHRIGWEGQDICLQTYPGDENGLGPVGSALRAKILAVQEGREDYQGWGVVCA